MGKNSNDSDLSQRDRARAIDGIAVPTGDDAQAHGEGRVSVTAVNEAVAEVMRGDNSERIVDQALAATVGGAIRPSVEKMVAKKVGSGSELLGLSEFRTVVSQYLNSSASSQVDAETRKAMLHKLETANRTSAEFSALVTNGARLAALGGLSGETAREVARSEGRRSSNDFAQAFNGGPYSASTLFGEMRGHVDTAHGITAAHVAGVGNYLNGLGINAQQYTGYFVGSSDAIRNAIQDQIRNGKKITDEQIKNPNDVKAIIGAIKAGKMKAEDAPPTVQQIMKDMEKNGLDPAKSDAKAINKYFEQNPKALEGAKKANQRALSSQSSTTKDAATDELRKAAEQADAKQKNAEPQKAKVAKAPDTKPRKTEGGLNLGG